MRMMCAYAGVRGEDVKYEFRQKKSGGWICPLWDKHKRELQETNPFVQLPYVVNHSTGEVVSQFNAVYLYLGRMLGLGGATRPERLANEQVLFQTHLMWMELRDLVYPGARSRSTDESAFISNLGDYLKDVVPVHYKKLEEWLRLRGSPFFAGRRPCTADFHVWELMDQLKGMAKTYGYADPVEGFEMLQDFYQRLRCLPALEAYFSSTDSILPVNNKMAFFGGAPFQAEEVAES